MSSSTLNLRPLKVDERVHHREDSITDFGANAGVVIKDLGGCDYLVRWPTLVVSDVRHSRWDLVAKGDPEACSECGEIIEDANNRPDGICGNCTHPEQNVT